MEDMKKWILALIMLFISIEVNAWAGKECSPLQIDEGKTLLQDVSYTLEYADNYTDMGGNFAEGYMRFKFTNLPSGYFAIISTKDGDFYFEQNGQFAHIPGGVQKMSFYSTVCDSVIKSLEFKVPHYKLYCGKDTIKCEENPFFDGTYENIPSNQNGKLKSKLSIALTVILIILVLIIVTFIILTIKRRKNRAKEF